MVSLGRLCLKKLWSYCMDDTMKENELTWAVQKVMMPMCFAHTLLLKAPSLSASHFHAKFWQGK